jgi:hypothetical protein
MNNKLVFSFALFSFVAVIASENNIPAGEINYNHFVLKDVQNVKTKTVMSIQGDIHFFNCPVQGGEFTGVINGREFFVTVKALQTILDENTNQDDTVNNNSENEKVIQ